MPLPRKYPRVKKVKPDPPLPPWFKGPALIKPSVDDPEAIGRLCDLLVGGMSMKKACALPDIPCYAQIYIRMHRDPVFFEQIMQARFVQQIAVADEMQDIADEATPENWQVARMRIVQRQWVASRLAPRVLGDRVQHANAAGDGNQEVIVHNVYSWQEDPEAEPGTPENPVIKDKFWSPV